MEVSGQLQSPVRFTPGERGPGTHWIGGCMGPGAGLHVMEKRNLSYLGRESNPGRPARIHTD
jgi:hypothetical protein